MRILLGGLALLRRCCGRGPSRRRHANIPGAPPTPWTGPVTNCGFDSLEQCRWTVSGAGGYCRRTGSTSRRERTDWRRTASTIKEIKAFAVEPRRKHQMRTMLAAAAMLMAASAADTAAAVDYPWCALYGDSNGGINCGFVTAEQCAMAISGNGGSCIPNGFLRHGPRSCAGAQQEGPAAPLEQKLARQAHQCAEVIERDQAVDVEKRQDGEDDGRNDRRPDQLERDPWTIGAPGSVPGAPSSPCARTPHGSTANSVSHQIRK